MIVKIMCTDTYLCTHSHMGATQCWPMTGCGDYLSCSRAFQQNVEAIIKRLVVLIHFPVTKQNERLVFVLVFSVVCNPALEVIQR